MANVCGVTLRGKEQKCYAPGFQPWKINTWIRTASAFEKGIPEICRQVFVNVFFRVLTILLGPMARIQSVPSWRLGLQGGTVERYGH